MFFYWTPGMPLILTVLMAAGSLFVFYCLIKAIRAGFRDVADDPDRFDERNMLGGEAPWRCPKPKCRAMNTSRAKYCRMCGASRAGHRAGAGF